MRNKWTPDSWKEKKALHQPIYNNQDDLNLVIKKLKNLPPLVFAGEVRELKKSYLSVLMAEVFFFKLEIVLRALLSFIQIILEIPFESYSKWLSY